MTVLLVIHLIVSIALVGTILLQRSEGGALGIGGSGGVMSARGAANLLTRATTVLATIFIGLSLVLAIMASNRPQETSVFDDADTKTEQAPAKEEEPSIPDGL